MNVLSLFDGMSCGQIALDQLGIKVDNYFSKDLKCFFFSQGFNTFSFFFLIL